MQITNINIEKRSSSSIIYNYTITFFIVTIYNLLKYFYKLK